MVSNSESRESKNRMSDQSFAALGLSADVIDALAAEGIESPFQIQVRAIPAALSGADVLATVLHRLAMED